MKRSIILALVLCALTALPQAMAQAPPAAQPAKPAPTPTPPPAPAPAPVNPLDKPQNAPPTCLVASACLPGDTVKVSATGPALTAARTRTVFLTLGPSSTTGTQVTTTAEWDGTSLLVTIPESTADDRYTFSILPDPGAKPDPTAKPDFTELEPRQVVLQRPVITSVYPAAAFTETTGVSKVIVLGSGFWRGSKTSQTPPEAPLEQAGATPKQAAATPEQVAASKFVEFRYKTVGTPPKCQAGVPSDQKSRCYDLNVDSDRQVTLTFYKLDTIAVPIRGAQSFVLAVRNVETNQTALTLIDTTQGTPLTVAVVGFLLIVVIIFLLLRSGEHATKQRMNGKDYWLSVLFYDVQTNSYSLSKCQFYAWTATAVIGYLYLAISKSFVQGSAIFPDIPSGLPGILIASVGTVVLSNGITSAKGDKGAGAQGPNLSDFIASGGVVAPDRLQFAIWTVVGIGTFLAIVFQSDPRNINDLPAIPSGFLQLMGISSGGYLAGKLARKAGPTIAQMVVKTENGMVKFQLTGGGLSRSAAFSIDDKPIFPDLILDKDGQPGLPEVVQLDPSITDPDYARILAFYIKDYPDSWLGPHSFTITNRDSQKATVSYQKFLVDSDSIKIASAPPAPPPAAPVPAAPAPVPAAPAPAAPAAGPAAPAPAQTTPATAPPNFAMNGECLDSNLTVICIVTGGTAASIGEPFTVVRTDPSTPNATGAKVPPAKSFNGTVTGLAKGDVVTVSITDEAGFTKEIKPVTVG